MSGKFLLLVKSLYLIAFTINSIWACENVLSFYEEIGCKRVNSLTNDSCAGRYIGV